MNHDRPLFKNNLQLAKAVNCAIDRQAILLTRPASWRASATTRSCRRASRARPRQRDALPAQGAEPQEGEGARQRSHRRRQGDPLDVEPCAGSAAGADLPVQPEADRARRRGAAVRPRACRSTKEGTAARRSTSRPKAGSPTTPIRTTSSTSCSRADSIHDANNNNVAYFNDPKFNKADDGRVERCPATARYRRVPGARQDITNARSAGPPIRQPQRRAIFVSSRIGGFTVPADVRGWTSRRCSSSSER